MTLMATTWGFASKWIRFVEIPKPVDRRTRSWRVVSKDGLAGIGEVRWYSAWRCYALFPEINTVFERTCLRDIADFCEKRTREHRSKA